MPFFFPSFCFFDMLISIFEEEEVEYSSPKNLSIVYGSTALLKKALINTFIHQKDLRVYVKFSNKIRFLTRRTIPPKKIKKMEISP